MRSPSFSSSSIQTAVSARGGGAGDGGSDKKAAACCSKVGLKRGPWTAEEDEMLADYIRREGEGRWRTLPKKAGLLRCGKSCRLRWMNYLRPSVKRGHITADEEDLIFRLHRLLGNRWSLIAGRIPGRTDNEIKNYWNTHLSKKLISQGIDPRTHKPFFNFNPNPSTDRGNNINKPNYNCPLFDQSLIISNNNVQHGDIGIITNNADQCVDEEEDGLILIKKKSGNCDEEAISSINEDGDIRDDVINNCCPDDAFSSFLNSLINDDMFNTHNQHDQDQDHQHDHDHHSSCLI